MVIGIDFDGTCVTHQFPELGRDIGAVPVLRELAAAGHQLILWTMRSDGQVEQEMPGGYMMHGGDFLSQAVGWFKDNGIPLYGIQRNPLQDAWTTSPKAYCHLYIDDAALGCPLVYAGSGERPYADWEKIREYLVAKSYLPK